MILLTVMFCDLVGSTTLAERLDPEDFRDVICGYQDAYAGVIPRFGGYIAKYLGDGILVYFGCPRAIDVARRQQAKLFELRAATSLGRLWCDRGNSGQAHQLIAPIYNWFTEGSGTPDLVHAKALVDESPSRNTDPSSPGQTESDCVECLP